MRKKKQNERAAQKKLDEIVASFVPPTTAVSQKGGKDQLFADLAKNWLQRQRGTKAPSTIAGYQHIVNDICLYFEEFNPVRTADLTASMVEDYLSWERMRRDPHYEGPHKRISKFADGSGIENTVMHRAAIVRAVLSTAKRDGIISVNAASKRDTWISLPRPQQHVFAVLTPTEAESFIAHLDGEPVWFRTAVLLALLLGLRRSEVIGLRESDIDLELRRLEVQRAVTQQTTDGKNGLTAKSTTKNNRVKRFPLSNGLLACLRDLMAENRKNETVFGRSYDQQWAGYLFRDIDGQLICPNALTRRFAEFIKRTGCKNIRYHDLRHSCASILHASGVSLRTVQGILGHSQLTTTVMYTHLYDSEKVQALDYLSERYLRPAETAAGKEN